jgi:hypothetical protein
LPTIFTTTVTGTPRPIAAELHRYTRLNPSASTDQRGALDDGGGG